MRMILKIKNYSERPTDENCLQINAYHKIKQQSVKTTLDARGFSHSFIALILHASFVSFLFSRGFAVCSLFRPVGQSSAVRSVFGRSRLPTKTCRKRTSGRMDLKSEFN